MFRPKEPFNNSETIQTRLIETVDGVPTLSSQCVQFARERPDDFVNYLRHAWEHEGQSVKNTPDVLQSLKSLKLNVVDKFNLEIQAFYLPVPKLLYMRNRYLLSTENFPFFDLQPQIPSDSDLGPWAFLQDIIGNNVKDDLRFYINLLIFLKRGNRKGAVQFPRRVLELYLRIHALCDGASDVKIVRQWFSQVSLILSEKGWTSPMKCYARAPKGLAVVITSPVLLPPPKDWEVSDFESTALEKFYKETLGIVEGSLCHVLAALDRKPTNVETVKQLSTFKKEQHIFLPGNESPWYRSVDCVWGRQLKGTELSNPAVFYPELESFFVDFLGLAALDIGAVYSDLINLGNGITLNFTDPREEHAKKLLVKLNDEIAQYGKFLDKEKLLQSKIFPVAQTDGRVRLCSISSDFYIADRQYLHDGFHNKINLLDLQPAVIWALEPFFLWAGLKDRYLSNVVTESSEIEGKAINKDSTPFIHLSRALGLLRIAVHFDSPRVATAAGLKSLTETLQAAKIHIVTGNRLKSRLCIDREGKQRIVVRSPFPVVKIEEDDFGNLDIFMDNKHPNYSMARTVPRCLARWLMTEPGAEIIERVDVRIEEYVKTIFRLANDQVGAIGSIFDAEGIVDVEKLTKSPYLTRKNNRVSPRVFSAEPFPAKVIEDTPPSSSPVASQVLSQVPLTERKSPTRNQLSPTQPPNPSPVPTSLSTGPPSALSQALFPVRSQLPVRRVLSVKPPSSQLKQMPGRGVTTSSSPSAVSEVLPQWPGIPTSSALLQAPSGVTNLQFNSLPTVSDDKPSLSALGQPPETTVAVSSPFKLFQGQDKGDSTGPPSSRLIQAPPKAGGAEPPCLSTVIPESPSLCPAEALATGDIPSSPTQNRDTPPAGEPEDNTAEDPVTASAPLPSSLNDVSLPTVGSTTSLAESSAEASAVSGVPSPPGQDNDSPSTVESEDSPAEAPATGYIPSPPALSTDNPLPTESKSSPEESPAPGDMPSPPAQAVDLKNDQAEALADSVMQSLAAPSTDNQLSIGSGSSPEGPAALIDMLPTPPAENPDDLLTVDSETSPAEAPAATVVPSPPELNTDSQLPVESESSPEEPPALGNTPPSAQNTNSTSTADAECKSEDAPAPSVVPSPPELCADSPSTIDSKSSPSLTTTPLPWQANGVTKQTWAPNIHEHPWTTPDKDKKWVKYF
ncbi:hypothetical protein FHETE_7886 [Fusarium heterosporum]|uniref:Uncharacterized protein n=1 Tax=Fusarium heterosporum TaxID=42747 RepID=A0A8H5T4P1_FUSHE|nr:hypothetical protein FHETE_7886 [Fusarium heterosporum]